MCVGGVFVWEEEKKRTGCAARHDDDKAIDGEEVRHCEGWRGGRRHAGGW